MKSQLFKTVLATALLASFLPLHAEDIDLFVDSPTNAVDLPNVLFIVDNTANWNTAFSNEMSALANTFRDIPADKFNIGIMFSAETGSPNNNVSGGYVRAAIRTMTDANKEKYAALIESLDKLADKGNGGASGVTMAEAYRYFAGGTPYAGNGKEKTDYTGNTSGTAQSAAVYALPGNALASKYATTYNSPIIAGSCAKNFIIYISNGANQENSSADALANSMLSAAGGNTTQLAISPVGSQPNPSDEWARFMKSSPLGIVTYVIDVNPVSTGQGPGWTALLKSMASVSGGKYAAVNSSTGAGEQIADAVGDALSEIQAVNSVFASVSLPVSVNTQGTYLNQVFVGMFRPDQDAFPRWQGNLKQYKLGFIDGLLRLQDMTDKSAINAGTGFITECARSYWTPEAGSDTYWDFKPQGACIAQNFPSSNSPDGNTVEKGAHGYKLRGTTSRSVTTCSSAFSSCDSADDGLTAFSTSNSAITPTLLGAASSTEAQALINWEIGQDIDNEHPTDNTNPSSSTTSSAVRPSVHGDVVHSRPVAINLGSDTARKVVVFYGANDGALRAINGNRTDSIGTVEAGGELWSFVPPEFYTHIKRLRDNNVQISFPNIVTDNPLPKPYGVDGPITAYKNGTDTWIYAAMRRGGRALYAFQASLDSSGNFSMQLKWKRGCPENFPVSGTVSDTGCSGGFTGIGQTWSGPKTLNLNASVYSSPVLIMGGGYDTCEDANPNTCGPSSKGNKIYVLNADTGALLNTLDTSRSVIADVVVVPDSITGLAKYAYAVDLGGNVYRIDTGTKPPDEWVAIKIASLGCATTATCTNNRKFMFSPDVVESNGEYVLLLGSGDREKPRLYTNPVDNYFFMLRDKPTASTWLSSETTNCGGSAVLCLNSLLAIDASSTTNPSVTDLAAKKGWYLGLADNEQVVTSAITIFGTVTFSTHQPKLATAGTCSSNLGVARVYNIAYDNAATTNGTKLRFEELPPSIGLPPSPVAGMVTLDNGNTVPFCIGCSPESPLEGKEPKAPPGTMPSQPKGRVYWYIQR